jgi:hypothetical protein
VESALDYLVPGAFFCLVGWIAMNVGPDSRPGDVLLHALSRRTQTRVWRAQRIMGMTALVFGVLSLVYGTVLIARDML